MRQDRSAVLVFCKPPVAGSAKTRLIPMVGEQNAAEIHRKLTLKTLSNTVNPSQWDTILYCATQPQHEFFRYCQTVFNIQLELQSGFELGERMLNAFQSQVHPSFK